MPEKKQSNMITIVASIVVGFFIFCSFNLLANYLQLGRKVVKLDKNLNEYEKEDYIPYKNANNIKLSNIAIWNIIPSLLVLVILAVVVFIVNGSHKKAASSSSSDGEF